MNKLGYALSTLLLATAAAPVCHAQEGVRYGYCADEFSGTGFNASDNYYVAAAFQMTESDVEQFDNCEVTGVSIGFGSGRNKDVTIFMTYDLQGEPFYTQAGRVRANQWCDIPVNEPVKIEKGKPFYIGYKYYVNNMTAHPIGTDDQITSYTEGADWMAADLSEDKLFETWTHMGDKVGNVSIRAIIKGDNVSTTNCVPVSFSMPDVATPGEPFDFGINFTNASSAAVNNVEVTYQLGTDPEKTVVYEFSTPVAPNEKGMIKITDTTEQDELAIPVWATINKVNGEANDMAARRLQGTLVCTTDLSERKMVVEKFTGVQCGFCPRGIVGFDYMNKYYTGKFIGIAIQNYSQSDPMFCNAYQPWRSKFSSGGAPYCFINRNKYMNTEPVKSILEDAFNDIYTRSSNIGIKVSAEPTSSSHAYDVTATVRVARDVEDVKYAIAFVVTEDHVGPYQQANNYNTSPGCPEFSGKGSYVTMYYDDVARNISSEWEGYSNSVPSSIKHGEPHKYTVENFSLGNTNNPMNANIIALLIDQETGEIVNADRIHLDPSRVDEPAEKPDEPDEPGSVDSVGADNASVVIAGQGFISFTEGEGVACVYTAAGQMVNTVEAGESVAVAPGLYVVKTSNGVHKVFVR